MIKTTEKIFLSELLKLVNTIQNTEEIKQIEDSLLEINSQYQKIQNKKSLWDTMDNMCVGISKEYFILLEFLYKATQDEYIIKKQIKLITDGVKKEEINLSYANFYKWQITSRIFNSYNFDYMYIERRDLQGVLMSKLYRYLAVDFPFIIEPDYNRIVVTSNQLLGMNHGPTRNIMDYCYTLKKKLHKEVFILISYEMPLGKDAIREYELPSIDYVSLNYNKNLDGEFVIEYQGEKFNGYQCHVNSDSKDKVNNILQSIYDWKPFLVYNIGAENLLSDICSSFTMGVSIPCAYNFPISESQFLILPRCIEENDKENVNRIIEEKQSLIESIFVYKLKDKLISYRKSDFGFSDDTFVVAIVGTRLDSEIDIVFAEILNKILEQDDEICIAIIGVLNNMDIVEDSIDHIDRVKYLGYQEDVRGVINIADLYLNPPRKGGGTSAIEAMAEGVPLITLSTCDVSYASENQFVCMSIDDMPKLVKRYKDDKDFYSVQSQKAIYQAKKVVHTENVLNEVINKILSAERRGIDVNEKG